MTSRSWCCVCLPSPSRSFTSERGRTPVSASSREAETSQLARPSFIVDAELGWPSEDALAGDQASAYLREPAPRSEPSVASSDISPASAKDPDPPAMALTILPPDLPEPPRRRKLSTASGHRSTTLIQCLPSNCAVTPYQQDFGKWESSNLPLFFAVQCGDVETSVEMHPQLECLLRSSHHDPHFCCVVMCNIDSILNIVPFLCIELLGS